MSEDWVRRCERILERIKRSEQVEVKDRLELVRSTRYMLTVLQRSVLGQLKWVKNPEIIAECSQEQLKKVNSHISEFARSFIKYDVEVTKLGAEKDRKAGKKAEKKKERWGIFYV